jgi:hypothetical protein
VLVLVRFEAIVEYRAVLEQGLILLDFGLHNFVEFLTVRLRPRQEFDLLGGSKDAKHGSLPLSKTERHGLSTVVRRCHGKFRSPSRVTLQPGLGRLKQRPLEIPHLFFLVIGQSYFIAKERPHGLSRRHSVVPAVEHLSLSQDKRQEEGKHTSIIIIMLI